MFKYAILIVILSTQLLGKYIVGDQISEQHQEQPFSLCYPETVANDFRFSDYNGVFNGGQYKVLILDIETTW